MDQTHNITILSREAAKPIEEAKRKLQDSIVILNRGTKNPPAVNMIRRVIRSLSIIQNQMEI